jgi:hypothetical protein
MTTRATLPDGSTILSSVLIQPPRALSPMLRRVALAGGV